MDAKTSIALKKFLQRNIRKLILSPHMDDAVTVRVLDVTRSGFSYAHPTEGVKQMRFADLSRKHAEHMMFDGPESNE